MADLDKVKRNVAKMVGMNAPESDIDSYIASQGTSIDEIRNYKVTPESKQTILSNLGDIAKQAISTAAVPIGIPLQNPVMQQFGKNILQNTSDVVQGAGKLGMAAINTLNPSSSQNTLIQAGKGVQQAYRQGGVGEVVNQAIIDPAVQMGKGIVQDIKHPGQAIYEKPVSTAMNVLPLAEGVGKGLELAGEGVAKGAQYLSEREIASLIRPPQGTWTYGKNPLKGIIDEGIVAWSKDSLVDKIGDKLKEVGKSIEEAYNNPKYVDKTIKVSTDGIDKAIKDASRFPETNSELLNRLTSIKNDISRQGDISNLPINKAITLKRDLGQIAKYTGRASDDTIINKALQSTYRNIDNSLDAIIPATKKLNERYANLLGAEVSASKRAVVAGRANMSGLMETGAGLATYGMTHDPLKALGVYGLTKAASSTPVKTATAQILSRGVKPVAQNISEIGNTIRPSTYLLKKAFGTKR